MKPHGRPHVGRSDPVTEQTQATAPQAHASPKGGARWPAWATFVTAGICPKTTATRTTHVGLGGAYVVHVVTFALAALLVVFLQAWEDIGGSFDFLYILGTACSTLLDVEEVFARQPLVMTVATAATFFGIELAILLAALVAAPWGARDEPIGVSFRHAVRRTWLVTPHALLVILASALTIFPLSRATQAWWHANPPTTDVFPPWSQQPCNLPPGSRAWQEYQALMKEHQAAVRKHQAAWDDAWARAPWYAAHSDDVNGCFILAAVVWVLWALLRSVGAPRPVVPVARPPLCEACGYNLTHAPPEGRCPECGEPVTASLGPDARRGPPWQRRAECDRWHAWWRCTIDPIRRPRSFGRNLQLCTPTTTHRGFLIVQLAAVLVVAWIGVIGCYVADTGKNPFKGESEVVWLVGPTVGLVSAVTALALTLFAAGVVAVGYHFADRRNLMPGTMQAVAYLGGYLVLWTVVAAVTACVLFATKYRVMAYAKLWSVHPVFLGFCVWLLPNLRIALGYVRLVLRITAGARYANR